MNQGPEKIIGSTNGCFDLLHPGHLDYLLAARNHCDFLWVGINSDASVKRLKGESRPILPDFCRAFALTCLSFVSAVSIFEEDTPSSWLSLVKPHIHFKGGDYTASDLPEKDLLEKMGARLQILPLVEGISTTQILNGPIN